MYHIVLHLRNGLRYNGDGLFSFDRFLLFVVFTVGSWPPLYAAVYEYIMSI